MRKINLALGLALSAGLFSGANADMTCYAQDAPASAAQAPSFDESLLEIPDGESSKFYQDRLNAIYSSMSAYVKGLEDPSVATAVMEKANAAAKKLYEKLAFATDLDARAADMYFRNYTIGVARDGELDALKKFAADEAAKENPNQNRIDWINYLVLSATIDKASQDELPAIVKDVEEKLLKEDSLVPHTEEFLSLISMKDQKLGESLSKKILEAFQNANDATRKNIASTLEGKIRFNSLVGNEMKVEGLYLDKTEIDWKSYRGKVVLVDFWATWCGPCVGEIPNVLALYEKYHEAGFDVLGYSLDQDLNALEKFEEERKLPWKTASRKLSMEANKNDGKNYEDLTRYYGVDAIPTMILVGKDGKVIDTHARGAHLKELLEKEFPEVK